MSQPLRAVPNPPPVAEPDLEQLVARYTALQEKQEEISAEQRQLKDAMERIVGVGNTITVPSGIKVTVAPPSRRFTLATAVELLRARDADALARCKADGFDAAKVKKALTGDELEWSMIAGTGANIVKIT